MHRTANYVNYGVREFGMSAIMNGIALHGGFIPFGATFLMFSDYARNAIRMAALMKIRVDLRVCPRFDRPGRGPTTRPSSRSQPLRLIPAWTSGARATPSRPRSPGAKAIEKTDRADLPDLHASELPYPP